MKKAKGITLIALVITIIVLLILAGVSISLTLGNNGILNQAKNGVEKHRTSSEEELIILGFNAYQTAKLTGQNPSKPDVEGASVTENGEDGWTVAFETTGKSYKLAKNGTIEEDKPFDPVEWDKTASDEDCFIWASDDPSSEDYGKIVGYTEKADNNTLLRYPSRTTEITFDYENYQERFNGMSVETSRSYTNNILKVDIPGTVIEIKESFKNPFNIVFNKLEEVNIEEGMLTIGDGAFEDCNTLRKIKIPNSVTSIGQLAFYRCSLESIHLPNNLKTVGNYAFDNCGPIESIVLPKSIETIGTDAFSSLSNLKSITIPGNIKDINSYAFYNCQSLSTVVIEDGVEVIGYCAFLSCPSLKSISIPESVTEIKGQAFQNSTGLKTIKIPISVINMGNSVFSQWDSSQTVNIEANEKPAGWSDNWNQYGNPIVNWGYTGD